MDSGDIFLTIFGVLAVLCILFFICRELYCWYFKINERLAEQHQTNALLEKLYNELSAQRNGASLSPASGIKQASAVSGSERKAEPEYERLASMDMQQLIGRGMLALEDRRFDLAGACFSEALNKDPHNGEAHLGLLLVENRTPGKDQWLEGIRRKCCGPVDRCSKETIEVIKDFPEYVRSREEAFQVKGSITKEQIHDLYAGIEYSYESEVNCLTRRMQAFEVMVNKKQFQRVMRYTEGSLHDELMTAMDEILACMNTEYTRAVREDEQNEARIRKNAPGQIAEADRKLELMAANAQAQKEAAKRERKEALSRGINGTKRQISTIFNGMKS